MSRHSSSRRDSSLDESLSLLSSQDSTITEWPVEFEPIRQAIYHLLQHEELVGVRSTSEQLVTPLNSIGGYDGSDELLNIDEKLIKKAFTGSGRTTFELTYLDLGIFDGGGMDTFVDVSVRGLAVPGALDKSSPTSSILIQSAMLSGPARHILSTTGRGSIGHLSYLKRWGRICQLF